MHFYTTDQALVSVGPAHPAQSCVPCRCHRRVADDLVFAGALGALTRRAQVRELAQAAGARLIDGPFLDFLDPWGNRIEVVAYADIQFSKAPHVLLGMQFEGAKSEKAAKELADKGMAL
jgi:hypothetical protein